MAAGGVFVVGVGMATAVGLSAEETAASVRAGVMRLAESAFLDARFEPITLAELPPEALPELVDPLRGAGLTARERRLLRLGAAPLLECLGALPANEPAPPLDVALPGSERERVIDGVAFLAWFGMQAAGVSPTGGDATSRGRAGGLLAIGRAAERIRSGAARFAVAGGIDTFRDPYVLSTLERDGRLRTAAVADGFIPGEGAGFVLLASTEAAAAHGLTPLASLSVVETGLEPGHLDSEEPYRGDGLSAAIAALREAGAAAEPIHEVYSSMNGENYWAKEWGIAQVRHRPAFAEDHGLVHPADCYGDVGAAAGPLCVGIAALAQTDGYGRAPALVYASSDGAERAAIIVAQA